MKEFIFLLLSLLVGNLSFASHMSGGHLEYECLGNDVYKVKFTLLRDCASPVAFEAETAQLKLKSVSCGVNCINLGAMGNMVMEVVNYGCGNTCITEEHVGFEKYTLEKIVTLPSECDDWMLYIDITDRNFVDFVGTGTYFTYTLINNENDVCNNSPVFNGFDIVVGCLGSLTTFENSFTEADGDVLVYELVSPLVGTGTFFCNSVPITFNGGLGLSGSNPFPSVGNQFNLNNSTGSFSFVPALPGTSYFSLKVKEYRSGVLIGETIRDGMIIVEICSSTSALAFSNWNGETTHLTSIDAGSDECLSFIEGVTELGEVVKNLDLIGLPPSQFSYTVTGLNTAVAIVTICPDWSSFEDLCEPISVFFQAFGISAPNDCFADGAGSTAEYGFIINPVGYCQENRYFTDRNPTTGFPMPGYAQASNMIYVGDAMPPGSGIPAPQWGDVIYSQDVLLEAGVGIDLPACLLPGGDCVVLNGFNQTLVIKPFMCSPECAYEPLDVDVHKIFQCSAERVITTINSGVPPYSYTWTDVNGNVIGSDAILELHDIVSEEVWDDGFEYNLYIEDMAGGFYTESDIVHGTKRFYEPITNNVEYFDYPPSSGIFEDGYYYSGQPGVTSARPFFISDSVNTTPPWYGATFIELSIWDRWDSNTGSIGEVQATLYHNVWNIENSDDFSIDNAEVYWNGHWNNDVNEDCPGGFPEIWVYRVDAKNCLANTIVHTELSGFEKHNCYNDDWTPNIYVSKSPIMDSTEMISINSNQGLSTAVEYTLYPNPTNGRITIVGDMQNVMDIVVYDITGNIVLDPDVLNAEVDLGSLSSGIYSIELRTINGLERMRILIQK